MFSHFTANLGRERKVLFQLATQHLEGGREGRGGGEGKRGKEGESMARREGGK